MQANFFENNKFRQELFDKALLSYKKEDKIAWTQNIVRTNMPVLAVNSDGIKNIVMAIPRGLEKEFLRMVTLDYYETTIVYAKVLNRLKNFEDIKTYLQPFAEIIDNWASCDALVFNLKGEDKEKLFELAAAFTKSQKPFVRRVGFRLFFGYIEEPYIDKIFEIINKFIFEQEYYVNMIVSWLLCEMFIKNREKTLEFVQSAKLNNFVKNKFVSKCTDSFRVSKSDKLMLKSLKN